MTSNHSSRNFCTDFSFAFAVRPTQCPFVFKIHLAPLSLVQSEIITRLNIHP